MWAERGAPLFSARVEIDPVLGALSSRGAGLALGSSVPLKIFSQPVLKVNLSLLFLLCYGSLVFSKLESCLFFRTGGGQADWDGVRCGRIGSDRSRPRKEMRATRQDNRDAMRINSKGQPRAWRQPSGGPVRLVRVTSICACCPLRCRLSFLWCGPKSCPWGLPKELFPQLFKISVLEQGQGQSEESL